MPIYVSTPAASTEPCTEGVARDKAVTPPAVCADGLAVPPISRSRKLVSTRLNAVVWELAMLPAMFSRAKDWALSPPTARFMALVIPMHALPRTAAGRRAADRRAGG